MTDTQPVTRRGPGGLLMYERGDRCIAGLGRDGVEVTCRRPDEFTARIADWNDGQLQAVETWLAHAHDFIMTRKPQNVP